MTTRRFNERYFAVAGLDELWKSSRQMYNGAAFDQLNGDKYWDIPTSVPISRN